MNQEHDEEITVSWAEDVKVYHTRINHAVAIGLNTRMGPEGAVGLCTANTTESVLGDDDQPRWWGSMSADDAIRIGLALVRAGLKARERAL